MVSRYSLALRDALEKAGVELLDIYRYHTGTKDKSGVIVKDVLRVRHKETGKTVMVELDAAKETMEIDAVVDITLKTIEDKALKKEGGS